MSNHDSIGGHSPIKVSYRNNNIITPQAVPPLPGSNAPVDPSDRQLLIEGQGTLMFSIPDTSQKEVVITFSTVHPLQDAHGQKDNQVRLVINQEGANFQYKKDGSNEWQEFKLKNDDTEPKIIQPNDGYEASIDRDKDCLYWVSIDSLNKRLRYGKGEMRLSTRLLDYKYDLPLTLFRKDDKNFKQDYNFINDLKSFEISEGININTQWKDPIITEPPVLVVRPSTFTMEAAAMGSETTVTSLSKECQVLYGNVADFQLNTPDFPDFEQAIEYSLRTPGCIGHEILTVKRRISEFPDTGEYKELYLRITLGYSQGESPGIPYVMEIWPAGCASPVHNHGHTHAIIKVLRGKIDVDLYRQLPLEHDEDKPLKSATFNADEVTYLMPQVNQFHRLKNNKEHSDTCITIQCYSYSQNDDDHYAYFDYVDHNHVDHFDPISDYHFLDFKAKVKKEWDAYLRERFWMKD